MSRFAGCASSDDQASCGKVAAAAAARESCRCAAHFDTVLDENAASFRTTAVSPAFLMA